jgi:serine/threonine protein kinase
METVISNIYKNKLLIKKNLGVNNNVSLYEGVLNNNNKEKSVMVKMIPRKHINNFKNTLIENGFLKYLSKYVSSKQFISLCHSIKLTDDYLIIVQEYPSGQTLREFIKEIMTFSIDIKEYHRLILIIMYKTLLALNYIHMKGVAHRNLTPDTIYVDYNKTTKELNVKLTDFSVSCGKYISLNNELVDKYCDVINLDINPPEKFNLDSLVQKIQKLINNQTRELTYLYLAKKMDVWSLGILFWKLLNYNQKTMKMPLDLPFPVNYKTNNSWNKFKGTKSSPLIPKLFKVVIDMMLSDIPFRAKSSEVLEHFITLHKYYDDYDNNLQN